ncbi:MAG: hypothetical protein LBK66_08945 [Spirochaetaceae bacterium]|jgi:hypothetical protein|nr:hypothetical protein [Spirochaetaceae bacterium]
MEALRKIIDSKTLETLFPLPKSFRNKDIEIIILPVNKKEEKPHVTRQMINEMLPGSITQSLIGTIQFSNISLEDIRLERLQKYESIN